MTEAASAREMPPLRESPGHGTKEMSVVLATMPDTSAGMRVADREGTTMGKQGKRRRIEPGIWRNASGSYMVRYYDPQERERAKNFLKLSDARNFKADVRISKHRGEFIDPRNPKTTFGTWAEKYLEQKLALRPRTRDRYESALRLHLLPTFGDMPLGAITAEDVQSWVVRLTRTEYEEGKTYGPESIRGYYDLFAAIMKLAVERGLIARSPCRGIELPSVHRGEQRYLTEGEVERLVVALEPRFKVLAYTSAYLGLRWQEIAGLRRHNLDMRPGRLASLRVVSTIERANGRYQQVEYAKSKAARRTLKMPDFLREFLAWHLKVFHSDEWVFPSPKGGFLRYDNFRSRIWVPAVDEARLAPLTFHELRHTAAAFMINDGADPLQVKRRMGHEDIRTTFDTYGHLFPDREEDLVAGLDRRRRKAVRGRTEPSAPADVIDLGG